ncbi:MAG: hypothetical protein FJY88_09700 [Candidatus Eisenbacteria bacterium]|nr:hypothetical protein [Candidatus Eisenbacteria bacterium]
MKGRLARFVLFLLVATSAIGMSLAGCAEDKKDATRPEETALERIQRIFPSSLHAKRAGKATFYEAADGFKTLTGVPISELACIKCHAANYADGTPVEHATYAPGCKDCHADPSDPGAAAVTDQICLGCHGRQGAEQTLFQDVHRSSGMGCTDCHSEDEMHGDGNVYPSFLAAGASRVGCEDCHTPSAQGNIYHQTHLSKLHCSACHVKSVSSCYNCHFETEIVQEKKRFFEQKPRTGFKMLMNYEGKVHTATFQALVDVDGETFVALAPFFGHSITKADIACGDCHLQDGAGNPRLQEYVDGGAISVTSWNAGGSGAERLVGPTGVIPVTSDWKTAFRFAFLDYIGEASDPINGPVNLPSWSYHKEEMDGGHIVYGSPLTQDQMDALIEN